MGMFELEVCVWKLFGDVREARGSLCVANIKLGWSENEGLDSQNFDWIICSLTPNTPWIKFAIAIVLRVVSCPAASPLQ